MEYDIGGGNTQRDSQAGSDGRIYEWEKSQELLSGKYTLWDHTFEIPHKHIAIYGEYDFLLEVAGITPDQPAAGAATHPEWFVA